MRKITAAVATSLLVLMVGSGGAAAHTSKASWDYHIGDALLQGFGFPAGVMAEAPNGDVVTVEGSGTFNVVAKTADGSGTFVHKNGAGATLATGTWTASSLVAFQFYGCTTEGLCGGRATLKVVVTPDFDRSLHFPAMLEINCQQGNPPAGTSEGIKLNIPGHIHFNKHVEEGGVTLFLPH